MKKNTNKVRAMSHNVCSVNSNRSYKIQIFRYGYWFNTVCDCLGCLLMTSDDSAALFFSKRSAILFARERIHPDLKWRVVEA